MKKYLILLGVVLLAIFLFTACGGPSEAEDAQTASNESVEQFLEDSWADANPAYRIGVCASVENNGMNPTLDVIVEDLGESSQVLRDIMGRILSRDC